MNALLLKRDAWTGSSELRDFGTDQHRTTFNSHVLWIGNALARAANTELLHARGYGRGMEYRLSERMQLVDERDVEPSDPTQSQRLITSKPPNLDEYGPDNKVAFRDDMARRTVFSAAIRDAAKLPGAEAAANKVLGVNWQSVSTYKTPVAERLSADDCLSLFAVIERGLAAAVQDEQTADTEQARIQMLTSYLQLYYAHLFMVDICARDYMKFRSRYDDLFQEGAMGLTKATMHFTETSAEGASGSFYSAAFSATKGSILHYLMRNSGLIRLPEHVVERRRKIRHAVEDYTTQHRRTPSIDDIASELAITTDQIKEAIADVDGQPLDNEAAIKDEQDFDKELREEMVYSEVHELFLGDDLTEREKIVMSLRFGIFATALSGAEFTSDGEVLYTYPYTEDDLPQGHTERNQWQDMTLKQAAMVLGVTMGTVQSLERSGLKKSRRILLGKGFDSDML